jgi:hypothetical protein
MATPGQPPGMPNVFQPECDAELQSGDMILRAARLGAAAC